MKRAAPETNLDTPAGFWSSQDRSRSHWRVVSVLLEKGAAWSLVAGIADFDSDRSVQITLGRPTRVATERRSGQLTWTAHRRSWVFEGPFGWPLLKSGLRLDMRYPSGPPEQFMNDVLLPVRVVSGGSLSRAEQALTDGLRIKAPTPGYRLKKTSNVRAVEGGYEIRPSGHRNRSRLFLAHASQDEEQILPQQWPALTTDQERSGPLWTNVGAVTDWDQVAALIRTEMRAFE